MKEFGLSILLDPDLGLFVESDSSFMNLQSPQELHIWLQTKNIQENLDSVDIFFPESQGKNIKTSIILDMILL